MTDFPNETEEWIRARLGKATASRMGDIIGARKDGKPLAARRAYMIELLAERFSGMRRETYMSAAMLWGKETEQQAKEAYLEKTGALLLWSPSFIDHPTIPMAGCSPDGYVDDDGLVEFKCPETHTHIGYCIDRVTPEDYLWQIQWQLDCTGRKWGDFVSYDPRLPQRLRMLVIRVERSPALIKEMREKVILFLRELDVLAEILMGDRHLSSEDIASRL